MKSLGQANPFALYTTITYFIDSSDRNRSTSKRIVMMIKNIVLRKISNDNYNFHKYIFICVHRKLFDVNILVYSKQFFTIQSVKTPLYSWIGHVRVILCTKKIKFTGML